MMIIPALGVGDFREKVVFALVKVTQVVGARTKVLTI